MGEKGKGCKREVRLYATRGLAKMERDQRSLYQIKVTTTTTTLS